MEPSHVQDEPAVATPAPVLSREALHQMLGQILVTSNRDRITPYLLTKVICRATKASDHRPYVRSLVSEGYLERVTYTYDRRGHYRLLPKVREILTRSTAPTMLAPEPLERLSPAFLESPDLQRIRTLAEQLAVAVEIFEKSSSGSGLNQILVLSAVDLAGLKRIVYDTAETMEAFGDDLAHLQEIAGRLRENLKPLNPKP